MSPVNIDERRPMVFNDVFRIVGLVVCWALAVLLGVVIFATLASTILSFASTGIGAVILALIGFKIWKDYMKTQ